MPNLPKEWGHANRYNRENATGQKGEEDLHTDPNLLSRLLLCGTLADLGFLADHTWYSNVTHAIALMGGYPLISPQLSLLLSTAAVHASRNHTKAKEDKIGIPKKYL